jgi:hypothetical protein
MQENAIDGVRIAFEKFENQSQNLKEGITREA